MLCAVVLFFEHHSIFMCGALTRMWRLEMAIRRRIAERMSRLKPAGLKTPIISEIPLLAKIIGQRELQLPVIVKGKAYGEVAGRWYKVVFPRTVPDPSVVAVANARLTEIVRKEIPRVGDIAVRKISFPKITMPSITLPTTPTITIPDIPRVTKTLTQWIDLIFINLADWIERVPAPLWGNWRNAFAQLGGRAVFWLQENLVVPQINRVRDSIRGTIEKLRTGVNAGLKNTRDNTQAALNTFRNRINTNLETFRANAETQINATIADLNTRIKKQIDLVRDRVNARLEDLYQMWGIPTNIALTPIHVRNVTSSGFEFQSYGSTTCYYIAVGESEEVEAAPPKRPIPGVRYCPSCGAANRIWPRRERCRKCRAYLWRTPIKPGS